MATTTTLVTPAENRFFLMSERTRRQSTLQQISQLLREHVTIKADSAFLKSTVRNLIIQEHANWLAACSHEWQLLASEPFVINPSASRQRWRHCQLCHKPVRYEYHVQDKYDHRQLVVGSECVKKFMNAETRYLMVITTEDNVQAVQQYQTLTAQLPTVPTIMFAQPWLPDLGADHRPQATALRQTTTATVTSYLKRRAAVLPLTTLRPAEQRYQQLAALNDQRRQDQQRQVVEQREREQQQQRGTAKARAASAAHAFQHSQPYRTYLQRLAAIIVTRPNREQAKQAFAKVRAPQTTRPLVNGYQFGQIVTEYRQTGQIQVKRLAMLDRQFVDDLDQITRDLDSRQTTRFYDDLYNSCWGWTYHQSADQRADWQRLLATRWADGLSAEWLSAAAASGDPVKWVTTNAAQPLQSELLTRLSARPKLQPVQRRQVRQRELRTFCQREQPTSASLAEFQQRFDQYYQLTPQQQAQVHETLAYYYVAHQYAGDHQAALQQFQWLMEH